MTNTNKKKRSKKGFLATFIVVTIIFAAVRHLAFSDTQMAAAKAGTALRDSSYDPSFDPEDLPLEEEEEENNDSYTSLDDNTQLLEFPDDDIYGRPHAVNGVWSFDKCFPDINDVQIKAAKKNGINPPANREEVLKLVKAHKLVDISNSPFYVIDNLSHSMPYLVPKAQHLLNTICLNFIDSLQMKGISPHLPMITSVLRTTDDVKRLQKKNGNATTNSCHCYGTTVDISYVRFVPLTGTYDESKPLTRWNFKMKQVLSEVLDDMRNQNKCYIKYEVKQGCYHLTIR